MSDNINLSICLEYQASWTDCKCDWNVSKAKLCTLSYEPSPMVLPKLIQVPRPYCFRKPTIDLGKDQSKYFAHWLMSQTPMVLPRTHLGSSQNSKSEVICPGLETQTKSILCTLAYEPNPYGSSPNSSWVIPDLNVWGNQSKTEM